MFLGLTARGLHCCTVQGSGFLKFGISGVGVFLGLVEVSGLNFFEGALLDSASESKSKTRALYDSMALWIYDL